MPAKTGGSHAIGAFVSLIVGTILSKYVWEYTPPLAEAAAIAGGFLTGLIGMTFPRRLAGTAVVMLGLAFAWGIVFHFARHG